MLIRTCLLVAALTAVLAGCPSAAPPSSEVTWHADIKPLLETYCTRCHQPGGQGTGDFTDDAEAIAMAERALSRIDAGEMPPPAADPACRDYHGSDRMVLPAAQRDRLAEWIADGKPEGDPVAYVSVAAQDTRLPDADLELRIPAAYTPVYADASNPGNEYRCFVMEHGRTEPFYITAFAPIVDQPSIVHHVILFKMPRDEVWSALDPQTGMDCMSGTGGAELNGMLAGWAPGGLPVVLEPGQGVRVEPDEVIAMQLHYYQSGPETVGLADQSGYQFKTTDSVDTVLRMFPAGTYNFRIPAGDDDFTYGDRINIPASYSVTVHTVFPHMHMLGKAFKVWADDGVAETCIVEGDYDFENQLSYALKSPVTVGPGSSLHFECTWDNSAENPAQQHDPPIDIYFGERTDEEMCFAFALVSIGF